MKLSSFSLFVASAGLAALQVNASPLRLVVVTSHQEVTSNFRFGHAMANTNGNDANPNVAHVVRPGMMMTTTTSLQAGPVRHHSCVGASLREKALKLSNAFRHALGFPLIEKIAIPPKPVDIPEGMAHIVPVPTKINNEIDGDKNVPELNVVYPHGHEMHPMKHHRTSFLRRIHRALMALGPWEGRAVAFVLGCGIGVLLRMIWVMTIVTYRIIRGYSDDEVEYTALVLEQDAEEIIVPPPQYTDEKVEEAAAETVDA